MLTTTRSDKRNRRQAQLRLECLDDRLVLSAAGGAAASVAHLNAIELRLENRLARLEVQHGNHVTPAMARIQTRIDGIQSRLSASVTATNGVSAGTTTPSPRDPHGLLPTNPIPGPNGLPIGGVDAAVPSSGGSTGAAGTSGSTTTTTSPKDPHGLLVSDPIPGPNGLPIGGTDGAVASSSGSSGSTTTTSPKDPHGLLVSDPIPGPNGLPIGGTD